MFGLDGIDYCALCFDHEETWDRMSRMMRGRSKEGRWTAQKMEYAWKHGVSERYAHISLDQLPWSMELAQSVNLTKSQLYF